MTVKLTQARFDVVVSLAFNIGAGAFGNSSLKTELNAGNYDTVPPSWRSGTKRAASRRPGSPRGARPEAARWGNLRAGRRRRDK